jgi:rfaE bifunctional protein kinase chain/domain
LKKDDIINLFNLFASKKILVVGDVMIDSYMWGKVDRISPEAPVPIIACTKRESRLGGAANVALNLLALGSKPILCGVIGNNDNGALMKTLLQDNKLETKGMFEIQGRPTTVKTRVIGGNQHLLRIDEETDKALTGNDEINFTKHVCNLISSEGIDAIIFQDYDKGALTPHSIKSITDLANSMNIPTLVDPKKRNFANYQGVTLFKPNFKEFTEGLKLDLPKGDFDKIAQSAYDFQQKNNIRYLLLTLSEKGVLISESKSYHHIPAHIRDISDVSGAGDTVISVASLCLASGLKPNEIAAISNLAGGLVCEKVGVVPIDKQDLFDEVLLLSF